MWETLAITENLKELWGRQFAVVPMGLSENDVSDFIGELMARHEQVETRIEQLDSLHQLAEATLQEAQDLAESHKSEERKQSDEEAQTVIAAATERAQLIVKTAEKLAKDLKQEAKTESERQAASAMLVAETKAKELIVRAQDSAERRLNNAQDRVPTEPHPIYPQPTGQAQGPVQVPPGSRLGQKTQHTFRWAAVPGATRYGLYVCRPPYGKEDFDYVKEDLTETSLILPIDLEPNVIYKWTIRAGNSQGWGKPNPFKEYPT